MIRLLVNVIYFSWCLTDRAGQKLLMHGEDNLYNLFLLYKITRDYVNLCLNGNYRR